MVMPIGAPYPAYPIPFTESTTSPPQAAAESDDALARDQAVLDGLSGLTVEELLPRIHEAVQSGAADEMADALLRLRDAYAERRRQALSASYAADADDIESALAYFGAMVGADYIDHLLRLFDLEEMRRSGAKAQAAADRQSVAGANDLRFSHAQTAALALYADYARGEAELAQRRAAGDNVGELEQEVAARGARFDCAVREMETAALRGFACATFEAFVAPPDFAGGSSRVRPRLAQLDALTLAARVLSYYDEAQAGAATQPRSFEDAALVTEHDLRARLLGQAATAALLRETLPGVWTTLRSSKDAMGEGAYAQAEDAYVELSRFDEALRALFAAYDDALEDTARALRQRAHPHPQTALPGELLDALESARATLARCEEKVGPLRERAVSVTALGDAASLHQLLKGPAVFAQAIVAKLAPPPKPGPLMEHSELRRFADVVAQYSLFQEGEPQERRAARAARIFGMEANLGFFTTLELLPR